MRGSRNLKTALAAAIALALGASAASAATITVASADDDFHASTCNLRNAIASFRTGVAQGSCVLVGSDSDTIDFAPALANSTITLARGELTITGPVIIAGSGQTIDADYGSRVLYVVNGDLTASDLTLTHGYAGGTGRGGSGAGMYVYSGSATLTDVTISDNFALGEGGGIDLDGGSLTLSHATVSGNTSVQSTGGISVYGTANIGDSTISGNTGARTGGIAIFSGYSYSTVSSIMSIARSTIANNSAVCTSGPCTGGIYSDFGNFIAVNASSISGNNASGTIDLVTGGMYLSNSVLTLVDSTVAQNSAKGNSKVAGAISHSGTLYGTSVVINATISGNSAASYNAGSNVQSGMLLGYGGDSNLQLRNSIIAGNAGGTDLGVSGAGAGMTSSVAGTIADIAPFDADATNHFTDAPGLGPLQNNGGPTQTMALLPGSVAIDGGKNAFVSTNYDQRGPGFPRVFNGTVDIGAVEFQGERIFANGFEPGP